MTLTTKMPQKKSTLFLSYAQLQGFKSIEDLSIDFERGLNILIGKNASGKSNFLECLFQVLRPRRVSENSYKYSKLKFISSDNHSIIWESEKEIQSLYIQKEDIEDRVKIKEKLFIDNIKVFDNYSNENQKSVIVYNGKKIITQGGGRYILNRAGFRNLSPVYIKFNLPTNLDCISKPATLKINFIDDEFEFWDEISTLSFLDDLLWEVEILYGGNSAKVKEINKTSFLKSLKIKDEIIENLKKYTPIQDIKFNENINIYKGEKFVTIENIKIDFKLNNNWIPWSQLSDGTKRLFYIITEITNHKDGIILVEEPELGIHPHQFNQVMDFLKEESEDKQIIISTHSPQALNHLSEDELSNILITYFDPKKKTQIKHLTSSQVKKAKRYMKEVGFFSDYWMLSDIE